MTLPAFDPVCGPTLLVRPVHPSDLSDLFEANSDDAVTQFLPYASWRSPQDAQAWLLRMQALREAGGATQLVLQRLADGKVVGSVLLFKFDEGSARVELGYVLARAHWRQGLATEALRLVCSQVFGAMGLRRIEAEVNPANAASNALLLRLGFVLEGRLRQRWVAKGQAYDTNVYGCLAQDWGAAG